MASLISWLAYSGARKVDGTPVATGYAYFYQPDTTDTQVSVYSDEDGLTAVTQPVRLDASGRAVVYTRVACRIAVQDSAGASVQLQDRANTIAAAQVEIENDAATGLDLTTGSQVQGGRTDLDAFLSSLYDSHGAPDGLVRFGGTNRRLQDVLAATTALFFNVMDSTYGAVGDDSTDDSAAIQAAITAAETAGGGIVYFPPGTYKVTTALFVTNSGVSLLAGGSPGGVTLKNYANNYLLRIQAAEVMVTGLTLVSAHASAILALVDQVTNVRFIACTFSLQHATAVAVIVGAGGRGACVGCHFLQTNATANAFNVSATGALTVSASRILLPTASSAEVVTGSSGGIVTIVGTEVNHTAASGTTNIVANTAGLMAAFTGCWFPSTGGGSLKLTAGAAALVTESGSILGDKVSTGGVAYSTFRNARYIRTSGSATSYTPDAMQALSHEVISSGASFAFANPSSGPAAITFGAGVTTEATVCQLILRYTNTSGGAITPTFGTNYKIGTAPSVGNNQAATWHFTFDYLLSKWVQIGGNPVAYAT